MSNVFAGLMPMQDTLPGVFTDLSYHSVNGSLWTLAYEVLMYIALGSAAIFGRDGIKFMTMLASVLVLLAMTVPTAGKHLVFLDNYDATNLSRLICAFFLGVAFHFIGRPQAGKIVLLSIFLMFFFQKEPYLFVFAAIGFAGGASMILGTTVNADVALKGNDYSYGLYIYAMPIQQIGIMYIYRNGYGFAITYAITLIGTITMAALSWHLIEKPALRLKEPIISTLENLLTMFFRALHHHPESDLALKSENPPTDMADVSS